VGTAALVGEEAFMVGGCACEADELGAWVLLDLIKVQ